MSLLQEFIVAARNIRAELKIEAKRKVTAECLIQNPEARKLIQTNLESILRLAALSEIRFATTGLDSADGVMRSTALFDLRIPYGEGIDRQAEIARLKKEIDRLEGVIQAQKERYDDLDFRKKAPQHVVENIAVSMVERQLEQKKLKTQLEQLERGR
jgi:valyl-tRNA synthetase